MINVFQYQNYRTYLRDYYQQQKKAFRYFSYRYFSKKAGINASAFLYYVIENRRNLTKSSILKISSAIGHAREEAEYSENLASESIALLNKLGFIECDDEGCYQQTNRIIGMSPKGAD